MTQSGNSLQNRYDGKTLSGTSFLIGGVQWFLGILAAESWHDGYSSRIDYVSELGIGPTAWLYNLSVFILGVFVFAGAFFLNRCQERRLLPALLAMAGVGAMGVGIFPGYLQPMHSIFTLIAILFGGLGTITSYSYQKAPMSIIALILGLVSLSLTIVFFPYLGLPSGSVVTFFGIPKGSMERWAIYPILAWIISYGGYLIGTSQES